MFGLKLGRCGRSSSDPQAALKAMRARVAPLVMPPPEVESPFTIHCDAVPFEDLALVAAPRAEDRTLLEHASRSVSSQSLPAPIAFGALEFEIVAERTNEPVDPTCLEQSVEVANLLREELRLSRAALQRRDGAVALISADESVSALLLAKDLQLVLKMPGEVVAFVATDTVVTFADPHDAKAVRAAASIATARVALNGDQYCLERDPLVLRGGKWVPWSVPPSVQTEVALYRRAITACRATTQQDAVEDFLGFAAAKRSYGPREGSTATLRLNAFEPQVVARADQVELIHTDDSVTYLDWNEFERRAVTALKPVELGDRTYRDVMLFDAPIASVLDTRVAVVGGSHRRK